MFEPWSLPAQDPCQPKIPVNRRSQSAQDPSQPKIQVSPGCPHVYLVHAYLVFGWCIFNILHVSIWNLAHVYLVLGSSYCIWFMWNPHQLNFHTYITYLLGKHLEVKLRQKICQLSQFSRKFLWVHICNVFDFCYFLNAKYFWAINPQTNHSVAQWQGSNKNIRICFFKQKNSKQETIRIPCPHLAQRWLWTT